MLALPAIVIAAALGGGLTTGTPSQSSWSASSGSEESLWWSVSSFGGVAAAAAVLAWFFIVWLGRAPRGLRDLTAYALGYGAQAGAYLFLLTPRYPTSDPELAEPYSDLPEHPVRAVVDDDLVRPRLTVLFRFFLAIPHFVWIFLWSIAVVFVAFVGWIAALVLGRLPDPLHRFLAAYIRYATHLVAFVYLVGRRFPGFTGREGSYGIDLAIDPPTEQRRLTILFRFFLALPAFIVASALGGVAFVLALLVWWYALVTARMPEGMRNLGVTCLRYAGQTYAYAMLVTGRYPYAAPVLRQTRAGTRGARRLPDARPRRHLLRIAFVALGAVALAAAAYLLYPTAVPDSLVLGPIDVDAVFGADLVERAKRYERFFYVDWVLAQIALLVTLWIYAKRGAAFARESSAGPIGTGMLLGMLGLAFAWIVHVPFALAAHWWQRRWDQNDLSYLDWLFQDWAVLAAQFLSICVALLIVMGLARKLGDRWWLPGAAVFVGIAALFSFVAPYLDFTTTPLKDKALLEAAADYESKLGLGHIPLRVEKVSPDTDEANAYAFGLGPSRRVVFWDTILRKPFTKEEQKVVLAHELGHHSQEHLPKGLGWFALFAIPGRVDPHADDPPSGWHGRPRRPFPLALLVVAIFQLATLPLANHISSRMEAEADWKALEVTRDPAGLEDLMVEFGKTSLGDPAPPLLAQIVFGTHPTLADRIAMARAFETHR